MATREEIDSLYSQILGRRADESGLSSYSTLSADEIRDRLKSSDEYVKKAIEGSSTGGSASVDNPNFFGLEGDHNVTEEEAKWIVQRMGVAKYITSDKLKELLSRATDQPGKFAQWVADEVARSGENEILKKYIEYEEQLGVSRNQRVSSFEDIDKEQIAELVKNGKLGISASQYSILESRRKLGEALGTQMALVQATQRYSQFLAQGGSKDDEYSWSEGGGIAVVDKDQKMGDGYADITDSFGEVGKRARESGKVIYFDEGSTSGLLGVADEALGTDMFTSFGDTVVPNELKSAADLYTLNLGTRIAGGSEMHSDSVSTTASALGMKREEVDAGLDVVADATVGITSMVTGQWWLIPAFKAVQGVAKKTGGTYSERNRDWSDYGEDVAWSAAGAASGPLGGAIVAGARTKMRGGSWNDALESAIVGYTIGRISSSGNTGLATAASAGYAYSKGGSNRSMNTIMSGATTYASSTVSKYNDQKYYEQTGRMPVKNNTALLNSDLSNAWNKYISSGSLFK